MAFQRQNTVCMAWLNTNANSYLVRKKLWKLETGVSTFLVTASHKGFCYNISFKSLIFLVNGWSKDSKFCIYVPVAQ